MYPKSFAIFLLLCLNPTAAADTAAIETATGPAATWLEIVDELDYKKSWSEASLWLRAEVSEADWSSHLSDMREWLGELQQRTLTSTEFHESLPEMPDGHYAIFTYDSSFENSEYVTEVVAVAKDEDHSWRVIGYYFP